MRFAPLVLALWLAAAGAAAGELVILDDDGRAAAVRPATATAPAVFDSAYTDLDLDDCLILAADDFGASWACPGYRGYPVRVAEGDLRFFISFGFGAPDEVAASQTPPPFNTLGDKIEWRLSRAGGGWQPVAAIVRYRLDATPDLPRGGEVLAVIQLGEGMTCHIGWIDARATRDANVRARELADAHAGRVDCADEAVAARLSLGR